MVNREVNQSGRTVLWRTHRISKVRQLILTSITTLSLVLPTSFLLVSAPASAAGDANFVGSWKVSGGYLGFIIKSENRHSGVCTGSTPEPQYHLVGCRVNGHSYSFTITEGSSYRSRNTGTFSGNRANGKFSDTNRTVVKYTAVK
jgi:hypothetical protein